MDKKTKEICEKTPSSCILSANELKAICWKAGIDYLLASRGCKCLDGYTYIMTPAGLFQLKSAENGSFSFDNFEVISKKNQAHHIQLIDSGTEGYYRFLFIEHYGSDRTDDATGVHLYDPETDADYWIRETVPKNCSNGDNDAKPDYKFSYNLYYEESAEIRKILERKARFLGFFKHSEETIQPDVVSGAKAGSEKMKTKFLGLSLKQYLIFLPMLLLLLGVFVWLAREFLFFDFYLNALSAEGEAIEEYVQERTDKYYHSYIKANEYSQFWEWVLSVHDREKYMASKGYEFHGNWGLHSLPRLDDVKGMYYSSYGCLGRRIADGRYAIYYDYPTNSLSFMYSAYGVNVEYSMQLDNYQRRFVRDGTWMNDPNYNYDNERSDSAYWVNYMYYGLATEYRANKLVASGDFFILEKATKKDNLGGFYSYSEREICLAMAPESMAILMGEDMKEELIKNRANPLVAYEFQEEVKKKIRRILRDRGAASILIHEGGHAIQYSLRLYDAWEYIARFLENRQFSIRNI